MHLLVNSSQVNEQSYTYNRRLCKLHAAGECVDLKIWQVSSFKQGSILEAVVRVGGRGKGGE